tara:strand:+ start:41 stop:439 length:399 start_codon:yes stop_codon:yes gene_type:complete
MKFDKILVEISPGEIIDKITILSIKLDMISDENKLKNINYEYSILLKTRDKFLPQSPELEKLSFNLREVNEKLWQIEDEIRDCESRKDFSKNFVDLARAVYITNDERSDIKREINLLLDSKLIEEKSYQSYQ